VEYLRNHIFYHRAEGEHPERKIEIKITTKITPQKTGYIIIPVCQAAVLMFEYVFHTFAASMHNLANAMYVCSYRVVMVLPLQ
jgi:hypothetical protein